MEIDIIRMVMDIVGQLIDQAFELANDVILQQWANDVIEKAATHSEDLVMSELSSTPELIPNDFGN